VLLRIKLVGSYDLAFLLSLTGPGVFESVISYLRKIVRSQTVPLNG
jgi:hypothetical protein